MDAFGRPEVGLVTDALGRVDALEADLRHQVEQLRDLERHALAVTLLSWDSPAGAAFRSYLSVRCGEISRSMGLLETAAHHLHGYGDHLRDVEALLRGAAA